MKRNLNKHLLSLLAVLCLISALLSGCGLTTPTPSSSVPEDIITLESIPEFSGTPYIAINGNVPYFTQEEITNTSFEFYSELDSLGRCGFAIASIGTDIMPTEDRGNIGSIKPSGWHSVKYDHVDGKYLFNRCHLIAFMLAGENANEQNLITGTRYMNTQAMLPFEDMVHDYVVETQNHVMYRVTPIFKGNNLVASGCLMEGYSVEDEGDGILFCIYAYNAQPGVTIDYATGQSSLEGSALPTPDPAAPQFILNTSSKKIHMANCSQVDRIKDENKLEFSGNIANLLAEGYTKCQSCFEGNTTSSPEPTIAPTLTPTPAPTATSTAAPEKYDYVLNTNSKKFHLPSCSQADKIKDENKSLHIGTRDELINSDYSPCGICKP